MDDEVERQKVADCFQDIMIRFDEWSSSSPLEAQRLVSRFHDEIVSLTFGVLQTAFTPTVLLDVKAEVVHAALLMMCREAYYAGRAEGELRGIMSTTERLLMDGRN